MPVGKVRELEQNIEALNLPPGRFHIELRKDKDMSLYGYAAIKTVGKKNKPVLATIYSRDMGPPSNSTPINPSLLKRY